MDISEPTTISQESSGISPESDRCANNHFDDDDLLFACNKMNLKTEQFGAGCQLENYKNRNIVSHSSLTLVDEHPLMPVNIDDNDLSENFIPNIVFTTNIPDVVPAQEHASRQIDGSNNDSIASPSQIVNDNKIDLHKKDSFSSDESEPDVSQYQACVESTYQSVSLTNCATNIKRTPLRKIPLTPELMSHEDPSSVETFSNNSFDDEFDEVDTDLLSHQLSKSNNKNRLNTTNDTGFSEFNDSNQSAIDDSANASATYKPLSVTLADGQHREIDMKVIEPYKRVLSHGGYLKAGGHSAIVIFSACFLPDRSRTDYNYVMENLFLYVLNYLLNTSLLYCITLIMVFFGLFVQICN